MIGPSLRGLGVKLVDIDELVFSPEVERVRADEMGAAKRDFRTPGVRGDRRSVLLTRKADEGIAPVLVLVRTDCVGQLEVRSTPSIAIEPDEVHEASFR